jgi:hypothetical protein
MPKPSLRTVSRKSRKPAEKPDTEQTPTFEESVVLHLRGMHAAMNAIAEQIKEHNDLLVGEPAAEEVPGPTQITEVLERLDTIDKLILGSDKAPFEALVARVAALESATPAPARRGRPPKVVEPEGVAIKNNDMVDQGSVLPGAAPTTPQQAAAATPAEVRTVVATAEQKLATPPATASEEKIKEYLGANPGAKPADLVRDLKLSLNRAVAYVELWGTKPAAQQTVTAEAKQVPTPAAPVAPPSVDDLRSVAITWIGKHSKEKFADTLKKYGASNLSTVPEEQRAALMAELNGTK